MKNVIREKIYVKDSGIANAGRGVFAGRKINKGEIVEICPIIELSMDETENLAGSFLVTYLFFYGKKKEKALLALGMGSIYNHSDKAKAKYKIREKERVLEIVAIEEIEADEEITISYVSEKKDYPLWFE